MAGLEPIIVHLPEREEDPDSIAISFEALNYIMVPTVYSVNMINRILPPTQPTLMEP